MTLSRKNDFERVLEIVEYKILAGILNPRERLIERELVEEYQISTGTVRKILKELAVKNLIVHMPNRGAMVSEPTPREVEDIYQARLLLENHALESVVANMSRAHLKKIETYEAVFEKKLQEKDLIGILNNNRMFHQSMFEICGNKVISDAIDQLRNRSRIWYHYVRGSDEHQANTVRDHLAMIRCLRSKDIDALKKINESHLAAGYNTYIRYLP